MHREIDFLIDSIDPLGQGVSKISDKITFIDKVLPGETGKAEVWRENSKVRFAKLTHLESEKLSIERIAPECGVYDKCYNCTFLHCNYDFEVETKRQNFQRMLQFLFKNIHVKAIKAPERFNYRNRVQLHYDLKKNSIGYNSPITEGFVSAENCLLPIAEVSQKIKELYKNESWKSYIDKNSPKNGHIEIYLKDQNLRIAANRPYADGGFTQVNAAMNQKLLELVTQLLQQFSPKRVIDLFGGQGNLTSCYEKGEIEIVDSFPVNPSILKPWQHFSQVNLYKDFEYKSWLNKEKQCDFLICDPPRSGVKQLEEIVSILKPKWILYVSCNSQTMIRDIRPLEKYELTEAILLDLFPGTHHFESVTFFTRK